MCCSSTGRELVLQQCVCHRVLSCDSELEPEGTSHRVAVRGRCVVMVRVAVRVKVKVRVRVTVRVRFRVRVTVRVRIRVRARVRVRVRLGLELGLESEYCFRA